MAETETKSASETSRSNDSGRSGSASEARSNLSDKSRDALSGGGNTTVKDRDEPTTARDRAAGQERLASANQPAKDRVVRGFAQRSGLSAKDDPIQNKDNPFAPTPTSVPDARAEPSSPFG